MEHTLQEFFDRHRVKTVDFGLRAECQEGQWRFYIYPYAVNGETWDFEVNGNQLNCISVPSTLEQPSGDSL